MGPRAGVDVVAKRKSLPIPGIKPCSSIPYTVNLLIASPSHEVGGQCVMLHYKKLHYLYRFLCTRWWTLGRLLLARLVTQMGRYEIYTEFW
jgi:hypothetical protein